MAPTTRPTTKTPKEIFTGPQPLRPTYEKDSGRVLCDEKNDTPAFRQGKKRRINDTYIILKIHASDVHKNVHYQRLSSNYWAAGIHISDSVIEVRLDLHSPG
jgi:hypothetical protein